MWTASDDAAAEADLREQAANYCSAMASSYVLIDGFHFADLDGLCTFWPSRDLAWRVRNVAALTERYPHEIWAEAEAMIRCGFKADR